MSTVTPAIPVEQAPPRRVRPSTLGLVRGELFKVRHQVSVWIMLGLLIVITIIPYLILLSVPDLASQFPDKTTILYNAVEIGLSVTRVFSGFFLIIIAARMIGLEYRLGTIRVLLSRGVGRLQLFFAKLLTSVLIGLAMLVVGLVLTALLALLVLAKSGLSLGSFDQAVLSQFWSDTGVFVLTILVNMGVTILMAACAAVLGRGSAFGLSAALAFFPLDNIGATIMQLAYLLTNNNFWLNITAYFLGPNLNAMIHALVNRFDALGTTPVYFVGSVTNPEQSTTPHGTRVDGTHTLVVAVVYAAIFLGVSLWLTWRRDVQE